MSIESLEVGELYKVQPSILLMFRKAPTDQEAINFFDMRIRNEKVPGRSLYGHPEVPLLYVGCIPAVGRRDTCLIQKFLMSGSIVYYAHVDIHIYLERWENEHY